MPNYFLLIIYLLSIFSIFIVPLYVNLQRGRVVVLSFLPILLVSILVSITTLISSIFDNTAFLEAIGFFIFIFFEFLIFGYLMMFPILILVAFIVEYLRINYHYSHIRLAIIGGTLAAIIVAITFMTWKFVWVAFVSGLIAVLVQYYFTEYKKEQS